MRRTMLLVLAATAMVAPGAARASCQGPPAAFVGVSYDAAQREDFILDLDHFRTFANTLKGSYCLPEERVSIRSMTGMARNGYVYGEGTEAGFKADLAWAGVLASTQPDLTVFVMLASHGLFYADPQGARCGGATPGVGSYALLGAGGGEDGSLYDCELGALLAERFPPRARLFIAVDCSFCGGFSDSITAASGTVRDDAATAPSRVPGEGRVVVTGCAITTECTGGDDGGVLYAHLARALDGGCDGYTAPGFPAVQGLNVPVRAGVMDGACSASEWFFGAVASAYAGREPVEVQQQFRIKYGLGSLAEDIAILAHR